jgi:hypothetical protein
MESKDLSGPHIDGPPPNDRHSPVRETPIVEMLNPDGQRRRGSELHPDNRIDAVPVKEVCRRGSRLSLHP